MTSTSLATHRTFDILTYGATDNKDTISRLQLFSDWLDESGLHWYQPDLAAYRDHLLAAAKNPSSVSAHLSTIRAAYRRLLMSNIVRDTLYHFVPADLPMADRKAFVDEMITRVQNAIDPRLAPVCVRTFQDRDDRQHVRLTGDQASELLVRPGVATLTGLRDTALIAMLLCTGIREGEVVSLAVDDLYGSLGGEPSLHVRYGKGNKSRMVPYGDMAWCLDIVEIWLRRSAISNGPVFRGIYKSGKRVRPTPLTTRAVEYILESYPLRIDEQIVRVRPHDCRRTYARRLYESGMDLVAIQQNLGHADVKTTLRYIGTLGADRRRAKSLYGFDLGVLSDI